MSLNTKLDAVDYDSDSDIVSLLSRIDRPSDAPTPMNRITDTVLDAMFVAFVWRTPGSEKSIDGALSRGNVVHCEIVFHVECTANLRDGNRRPCWCASHPGFQHSTNVTNPDGTTSCVNKGYPTDAFTYHTVSFTAFRYRFSELAHIIRNRGVAPAGTVSGVVMRLDPYLNKNADNHERYAYFKLNPTREGLSSHFITREVFRWCLRQCVDQTNRNISRRGGYAHTRAMLGALAAQAITPSSRVGQLLSRAWVRPEYRTKWFCSEFVTYALLETGLFGLLENRILPPMLMTPSNLYATLLECNKYNQVRYIETRYIGHEIECRQEQTQP